MAHTAAVPDAASAVEAPVLTPVSLKTLAPWALFTVVLSSVALFFVGAEQSAQLHEFLHDGRHLLGFPCH
ncbi:CbtB-domain containing protein [Streptomyces sp. NPDC051940]|uniref:CbtB domain-containing protein n=1 Tax=Streptomyces sp. NPDC051940 TaxID=3155675 RepID=UPI00341D5B66